MSNWKIEIYEISNNVYKLVMTHKLGAIIEHTGTDIEAIKREALKDSIKIEREIKLKFKN